jgi:hypothetical protein
MHTFDAKILTLDGKLIEDDGTKPRSRSGWRRCEATEGEEMMSKEFERDRDGHIRSRKTRHFSPGMKIFINLALFALGALLFHWLETAGGQSHSAPKAIDAPSSN